MGVVIKSDRSFLEGLELQHAALLISQITGVGGVRRQSDERPARQHDIVDRANRIRMPLQLPPHGFQLPVTADFRVS